MIRAWFLISVLFALLPSAAPAQEAKWTQASSSASGTLYFDEASVKNDGQFVSLLALNDFKEPVADGKLNFRSMISRLLINCANNIVTTVYVAYRSGAMGTGDLVYSSDTIREAMRVVPGSMLAYLVDNQCK